jgi:PPOX class probable F420-dependent enzyme
MAAEHILPDPETPHGAQVRERLRTEEVVWLTTVGATGTPQPNPVWFLWQPDEGDAWGDGSFLVYNDDRASRLDTFRQRPRVSLHFNTDEVGNSIAVFTGSIEVLEDHPPAHEVPEYLAKYAAGAARESGGEKSLAEFMARYSVATRIRPTRVRGWR